MVCSVVTGGINDWTGSYNWGTYQKRIQESWEIWSGEDFDYYSYLQNEECRTELIKFFKEMSYDTWREILKN